MATTLRLRTVQESVTFIKCDRPKKASLQILLSLQRGHDIPREAKIADLLSDLLRLSHGPIRRFDVYSRFPSSSDGLQPVIFHIIRGPLMTNSASSSLSNIG